jgi:hypothetical protein
MKKIKDTIEDIRGDLDYLKTDREIIKSNYHTRDIPTENRKHHTPDNFKMDENKPDKISRNKNKDKVYENPNFSRKSNQPKMFEKGSLNSKTKKTRDEELSSNQNFSNEEGEDFKLNYQYRGRDISKEYKSERTEYKEKEVNDNTKDTEHLEKMIARLHVTINELQQNNSFLQMELAKKVLILFTIE